VGTTLESPQKGGFPLKKPVFVAFFVRSDVCQLRPASVNSNPLSGHQKAPKGTWQFTANAMDFAGIGSGR